MIDNNFQVIVIGGGIVGLAAARQLLRLRPGIRLLLCEKERSWGHHQTGHNSGVIHSGIYYQPGSLKARFALRGREELYRYCAEHRIPSKRCGKVVVAVREDELPRLQVLYQRGKSHGLQVEYWTPEQLRRWEGAIHGQGALFVPETGVVDFRKVADSYADEIRMAGGKLKLKCRVTGFSRSGREAVVETTRGAFKTRLVLNCAGLYSDKVARWAGVYPHLKLVPFRGEYYALTDDAAQLVKHLVYPVPDPRLPFLGVHLTRDIYDRVHVGPNAVLAFAREGYQRRNWNTAEVLEILTYPGFRRLARTFTGVGAREMLRSMLKPLLVKDVQRMLPDLQSEQLVPHPAGVRAQAVGYDGQLLQDFALLENEWGVHVLNAPSPAATASLAIGEYIAHRLLRRLNN